MTNDIADAVAFAPIDYLAWAKNPPAAKLHLNRSYAPTRTLAELRERFGLGELSLDPPSPEHFHRLPRWIAERFGVSLDRVLPASSCSLSNQLAMAAALQTDPSGRREVLVETPVYEPLPRQARAAGGEVKPVRVWRGGELDLRPMIEAISERTALVVLTHPHNPSGAVVSIEQLAELCDRAANCGARVLVDEVYREFRPPEEAVSAVELGPNVIVTESLSKCDGLPQLKVGWLVGPPDVIAAAGQVYDHLSVSIPWINQQIALAALEHRDTLLAEARRLAETREAMVHDRLGHRDDCIWHRPAAGVVGVLEPRGCDGTTFARTLLERFDTLVVPGHFFAMPEGVRLGVAGEHLESALDQVVACLDHIGGGGA